jgi:membrane associated rhomboid family serine protease
MFPLRDDNPTLQKSLTTYFIILANIVIWITIQGMGSNPAMLNAVCTLGLIPGELLHTVAAGVPIPLGGHAHYAIAATPNWATLITHMFLHGGWFHIIGNLWFLWVFGKSVEDAMGHVRFLFFYLLCGIAAAVAQMISDPTSTVPMIGASGAISGVMGAYAVLYPRVGVQVLVFLGFLIQRIVLPAWLMLGYWFLLQVVGAIPTVAGSGGGVAFWAHIGGFAAGIALISFFKSSKRLAAHAVLLRHWQASRTT